MPSSKLWRQQWWSVDAVDVVFVGLSILKNGLEITILGERRPLSLGR
jgi:hypothetical protein